MIISRTPLRISFAGGGTDFKEYYRRNGGAVVSTAINKYIYITVNKKFDDRIRVSYAKTEIVDKVGDIHHDLVRECLRFLKIKGGVEITSIADIPSEGTGLGSSSVFTVGLLNALYALRGEHCSAKKLAENACKIEIDIVGEPIGKQDQYIAAYGGLRFFEFRPDGDVFADPIVCSRACRDALSDNLIMFYLNITRRAGSILQAQRDNIKDRLEFLHRLQELALRMRAALIDNSLNDFGNLLHEGWLCKKGLADGITNSLIDGYYEKGIRAGALGGKVLGAGGGGFIIFYCPKSKQGNVRRALKDLKETTFSFEPQGSKIIYVEE
jgi:D-glycero-alpha-D-manno-heptose-7-phosphate kinase